MGAWKKTSTATYHIVQRDWRWSPEVWAWVWKGLLVAYLAGGLSVLYVMGGSHDKAEQCKVEQKQETKR